MFLVGTLILIYSPQPVKAQITYLESQITANTAEQWNPAVSGNIIVWEDYRNSATTDYRECTPDIYAYDLSTKTETRITTNAVHNAHNPDVSGNIIVWEDWISGGAGIYAYDLSTKTTTRITTVAGSQQNAHVSGNIIVWEDYRNGNSGDIYAYDLSTKTETRITTTTAIRGFPDVSGNIIVWEDWRNNDGPYGLQADIYAYDLSTKMETRITTSTADQLNPAISGNTIVWEDGGGTYAYNLSTKTETRIATGTGAAISGNTIVWVDWSGTPSIYAYDLSTKTTTRISTGTGDQTAPDVSGNTIVWQDYRNGNNDIYARLASFDDSFETGNFSQWTGTSVSAGETVSVTNTRSHHGSYCASFTSNGGGGTENSYCYKTYPGSELDARGYFYVSKSGIVDESDRFYFITLKAGSNNIAYAGWRKTGGVVKWNLIVRSGTSYVYVYSTTSPALNRWYCVELHWKEASSNGLGELWVDGTRVCSTTGKNTAAYGDASRVCFGLPQITNCASTTAYCDCVKVGTTYIGPEQTSAFMLDDGFESGFSAWSGTGVTTGETSTTVNTQAYKGSYSAKFTSNGGGGTEYAYCYKTISSSTELFARGYFFVSQSGIADESDRFYFIIFRAGSNAVAYAGWKKTGGVVEWSLIVRNGAGYVYAYSTTSPVLNHWYCVELHWKGDAANGLGELWADGVKVCSIAGGNTAYYGNVNQVRFGLPQITNCASTTIYCDSAKAAKTYIGIEP